MGILDKEFLLYYSYLLLYNKANINFGVLILLILNIVAFIFMLGVNFSSGIFTAYIKAIGGTELIISIGMASLYLTRGTTSIFVDKLSKKIPYKTLFVIAFLGSAISSLIFVIPSSPTVVAAFRAIQGIFSGLYWVLINIYAVSLASSSLDKFKNLSSVTIWLNLGGFISCYLTGKVASIFSPTISFYIGSIILLVGAFISLRLKDISNNHMEIERSSKNNFSGKEKIIIFFAIISSSVYAYISIGIPLFILQLGGSYAEIANTTALGILSTAAIIALAPKIKERFAYRTIMKFDYCLIITSIFLIFYFKNIFLIYFFQAILIGTSALERNLWYGVLQDNSSNFNKSISTLRGLIDYFGVILFVLYGFLIQTFGSVPIAITVGGTCLIFMLLLNLKKLHFLKSKNPIHINGVIHHFDHILHRI